MGEMYSEQWIEDLEDEFLVDLLINSNVHPSGYPARTYILARVELDNRLRIRNPHNVWFKMADAAIAAAPELP